MLFEDDRDEISRVQNAINHNTFAIFLRFIPAAFIQRPIDENRR